MFGHHRSGCPFVQKTLHDLAGVVDEISTELEAGRIASVSVEALAARDKQILEITKALGQQERNDELG